MVGMDVQPLSDFVVTFFSLFMMSKSNLFAAFALSIFSSGCFPGKVVQRPISTAMQQTTTATSFHTLSANTLEGVAVSMDQYKGKKIVVLNVASECGYTPQYADWEKFYEANKDKVVVLGFPCNQFGGQEPGDAGKIATFCQKNYGVTFPMFEKNDVKGSNQSPVYKWLTDLAQNGWNDQAPSWNFCKYLVNENGELVSFFASGVKPDDAAFKAALAK
jgi:glutathione peroxidase